MAIAQRVLLADFALANPLYANARLTVLEADLANGGAATTTKATLYTAPTGTVEESNPFRLDGDGKLGRPVYVDVPVIARVTDAVVASHDTGVLGLVSRYREEWETGRVYQVGDVIRDAEAGSDTGYLYICAETHTAATPFADDLAAGLWVLYLTGGTGEGGGGSGVDVVGTTSGSFGTASANYIKITGNTTGNAPRVSALGSDATIDVHLVPKGDLGKTLTQKLQVRHVAFAPVAGVLPYVFQGSISGITGTITSGVASAFSWQVNSDTAAAYTSALSQATGGNLYYVNGGFNFGNTGMTGGRVGLNVSHALNQGNTSNGSGSQWFHTGIQSQVSAAYRDGGLPNDHAGQLFGMFTSSELRPGAKYWNEVKGMEINVSIDRYASASRKLGLTIATATTDGEEGIAEEAFIGIGGKKANATTSTGLLNGLLFGGSAGHWGIRRAGSLITATPTTVSGGSPPAMAAAYGINWPLVTFDGALLRAANASIDGSGNIGSNGVTAGLTLQALNGITAKSAGVASFTVLDGGLFTAIPTFTVAASPGGGTTATGTVATMGMKTIREIVAAGTGYQVNDILAPTTGTGTQASIRVTEVNGTGAITSAVIERVLEVRQTGSYSVLPSFSGTTFEVSGGSGTGAQFRAGYTILTCALGTAGTLYPEFPVPIVTVDSAALIARAEIMPVMTATAMPLRLTGTPYVVVDGLLRQSTATGLTATGATQGTGLVLTADKNEVATVAAGTGVVLPVAVAGAVVTIWNRGANALRVYPASGGAINGLATNGPFVLMPGSSHCFEASSATQYRLVNGYGATTAGVFSPLDYGAVGDGTTDDTAAVQAAYSAVGSSGGTVIIPRGYSFALSATITVKSKTVTVGGGRLVGLTAASWPSGNFWCFKNENFAAGSITDTDIMFFGIEVDWTAVANSSTAHLFHMRMARNVVVSECKGINAASATAFLACDDTVVEKCRFTGFYNCGIDHWEGPRNAVVAENYLETTVSAQMVNFNPDPTSGSSAGYIADGFTMSGNVLVSTESPSTPCQIEPLAAGSIVKNVTIINNVFKGSYVAIRGDTRGAAVVGNTFSDFLGVVEAVLSYDNWGGSPSAITVSDNVIRDALTAWPNQGVIRVDCNSGIIADNQILGTAYTSAAIYRGTTNCQVSGNYVEKAAARHPGFWQDGLGSIPEQIAAAGAGIGTSAEPIAQLVEVTSATVGVNDGVRLINYVGFPQTITNSTAVTVRVYPANVAGYAIDGGAALAAVTLLAGKSKTFVAYTAGNYRTINQF